MISTHIVISKSSYHVKYTYPKLSSRKFELMKAMFSNTVLGQRFSFLNLPQFGCIAKCPRMSVDIIMIRD